MAGRSQAKTVDEYIAEFYSPARDALLEMRDAVKEAAPGASELISYAMPTYDLNGRHLVHFAGFERHIGFYPGRLEALDVFAAELEAYKRGAGSIQFPLDRPLPLDLVRRIVAFRIQAVERQTARKRK